MHICISCEDRFCKYIFLTRLNFTDNMHIIWWPKTDNFCFGIFSESQQD